MAMHTHISEDIQSHLKNSKVVVAPKITDLKTVPYLMEALQAGGVTCVEITLRTPIALEVMALVIKQFPEIKVMAGTIIEYDQGSPSAGSRSNDRCRSRSSAQDLRTST